MGTIYSSGAPGIANACQQNTGCAAGRAEGAGYPSTEEGPTGGRRLNRYYPEGVLQALNPQNLGGLLHFPLIQTLETITGLPTWAINDAQSATWAEYHALAGDIREMAFITLSTGVGEE